MNTSFHWPLGRGWLRRSASGITRRGTTGNNFRLAEKSNFLREKGGEQRVIRTLDNTDVEGVALSTGGRWKMSLLRSA